MPKSINKLIGFIIILFLNSYTSYSQKDSLTYYTTLYKCLRKNRNLSSNEIEKKFDNCIVFFSKKNDSTKLAESYLEFSKFNSNRGKYDKSFQHIWKALAIAKEKKDINLELRIRVMLSYLYKIFEKTNKMLSENKKILKLSKKGVELNVLKKEKIVSAYFGFTNTYIKKNDIKKAKAYLDSCYYFANKFNYSYDEKVYLLSKKGELKLYSEEINEGINLLKESERNFTRINPNYLSIIYYNLGNAYSKKQQLSIAKKYYSKALKNLEKNNHHYDFKTKILYELSKTLSKLGKHKQAYTKLLLYKNLSEQLFSSQSLQNENLLAIPNLYKEQLRIKDQEIQERDQKLLKQKAKLNRFRLLLITASSILLISLLFFYIKKQQQRIKLEQEKQSKQKQKNTALIELKNKELTSFTLQLIDKNNLIDEIIQDLNKYVPDKKHLFKSTKLKTSGKDKLWKQFDKRFTEVNKGFYEILKNKFPNLSPTELKHCALIKLNFSAKEMAQLLNISTNGVKTSRYRIRKKLELQRKDNLVKFISSL